MPALTLLLFGAGTGIGIAWTQGYIPITILPANSGSLSVELTEHEDLPLPNDSQLAIPRLRQAEVASAAQDDAEIFDQSEPEQEVEPATRKRAARLASVEQRTLETRRTQPQELVRTAELPKTVDPIDEEFDTRPPAPPKVHLRDRRAARVEPAAVDEERPAGSGHQVKAAAHQDPTESSNDGGDANANAKESAKPARQLLMEAKEQIAAGETLAAHRKLSELYWNHKELHPQMQELIDSTAKEIFFQSKTHFVDPYVIQDGDQLSVIARKYQVTWEYLAKLNRTDPKRIQIGQKLKVTKGPFGAVVDLREFALTVHLNGYYVKRYQVGIGKDGSSPLGKFPVLNKVENPAYTGPDGRVIRGDDPSNPLGERWLDLGDSYGIHGTIDPTSIGRAESRGCIRLRDKDVIEVYDFLIKGSEVVIRK